MASPSIAWKAVKHCVTPPFPTSDRSLRDVKFRLNGNEEPSAEEERHIESVEDWDALTPELFVAADTGALLDDTGAADDVFVSVICRDRTLCKFERAATWPLFNLPKDGWPLRPILDRFSRSPRLDVVVVATLHPDAEGRSRLMIPDGAALATKRFSIRVRGSGLEVPIKFVEPRELVGQGLDRGAVCFVRWTGEDVSRPPRELLEVWLNKELEDKFRALNASSAGTAGANIASSVAAQVYAEVMAHVLLTDDHEGEPDSLIQVVGQLIEKGLGMELEDARRQYCAPGGRARLAPWSWQLAGANKTFASMKL